MTNIEASLNYQLFLRQLKRFKQEREEDKWFVAYHKRHL